LFSDILVVPSDKSAPKQQQRGSVAAAMWPSLAPKPKPQPNSDRASLLRHLREAIAAADARLARERGPVAGIMIESGTIIDDSSPSYRFLRGVVPPPDSTPLNEQTRSWLVFAYRDHGVEIAPNGILK
jgi:hypothetical protein